LKSLLKGEAKASVRKLGWSGRGAGGKEEAWVVRRLGWWRRLSNGMGREYMKWA